MSARTSRAYCAMLWPPALDGDAPCPRKSSATTRWPAASASMLRPKKCRDMQTPCSRTSGVPEPTSVTATVAPVESPIRFSVIPVPSLTVTIAVQAQDDALWRRARRRRRDRDRAPTCTTARGASRRRTSPPSGAAGIGNLSLPASATAARARTCATSAAAVRRVGGGDASTALVWVMHLIYLQVLADDAFGLDAGGPRPRLRLGAGRARAHQRAARRARARHAGPRRRPRDPRRPAPRDGWPISGRKIFSTGSYGLRWMVVWAATTEDDPDGRRSRPVPRARRRAGHHDRGRRGTTSGCAPRRATTSSSTTRRSRATTPPASLPAGAFDPGLRTPHVMGWMIVLLLSRLRRRRTRARATGSSATSTSARRRTSARRSRRCRASRPRWARSTRCCTPTSGCWARWPPTSTPAARRPGAQAAPRGSPRSIVTRNVIAVAEQAVALVGNAGLTRPPPAAAPPARRAVQPHPQPAGRHDPHERRPRRARTRRLTVPVEFIGMIGAKPGSETDVRRGPAIDHGYLRDFARAHEEARLRPRPHRLRLLAARRRCRSPPTPPRTPSASAFLIAHRPGFVAPTVAARAFATLDQLTGGPRRGARHHRRQRRRAASRRRHAAPRTSATRAPTSTSQILDRAWRSETPFDYAGRVLRVRGLRQRGPHRTSSRRIPLYFGGSSDAGDRVGGQHADVFALWGEPLAETAEQIAAVRAAAEAAGRDEPPRISVSFRPILGDTDEEAWERAHRILEVAEANLDVARAIGKRFGLASGAPRERRLAAAAGRRRARRAARPRAVDADRQGRRRRRQHDRARRHARDRRAGAARLRRHRRHDAAHPRLRPARRRRRLRPAPAPARPPGGRTPRLARSRVGHSLRA